jgi:hypothetical protein
MMFGRDYVRNGHTSERYSQHECIANVSIAQLLSEQRSSRPQIRKPERAVGRCGVIVRGCGRCSIYHCVVR